MKFTIIEIKKELHKIIHQIKNSLRNLKDKDINIEEEIKLREYKEKNKEEIIELKVKILIRKTNKIKSHSKKIVKSSLKDIKGNKGK